MDHSPVKSAGKYVVKPEKQSRKAQMNKEELFDHLKEQDVAVLVKLLQKAYEELDTNKRRIVFGRIAKTIPAKQVDDKFLLKKIKDFYKNSLAGKYYAPFDINSKNFSHIPEETEGWFEHLVDLLAGSASLAEQGEHQLAIECFTLLYELIARMEDGEEIVFADECGSWMIPADEKIFLKAFLKSLAKTKSAEEFAKSAMPLIRRDSRESFSNKVYLLASSVMNKKQKSILDAMIEQEGVRTKPDW